MKTTFVFILVIAGLFWSCKKNEAVAPAVTDNDKSVDIQVSNAPATISIPNVIEMVIPQGAFNGTATIKIVPLNASSLPVSADFVLFESFDISSTSGKTFAKNLDITFKYDQTKGKKGSLFNGAAYYNEDLKKWIPFSDVAVDTVKSEIHIKTNHLCKLGRYSYTGAFGYSDWASSLHFNIYWNESGILSNAQYNSPYKSVNVGSDPWYVQDIEFYLETAFSAYKKANLSLPDGKINVYLKDLGTDDGMSSFTGNIYINQKIQNSKTGYATTEEILPMACAHELLHYVQDYYYMQLFSEYTIKWWLEATAVQADRYVWPSNKKFEVVDYGKNLYNNLSRSWDDCNRDPDYYIAGTFLSYLINYRTGTKLSLPEIITDGGKATDISYMRTILDNGIKSKLSSSGIGEEFVNFIKWAIEGKSDIILIPSSPTPTPVYPNFKSSILQAKTQKETQSSTIPHLATAFFKALNKTNEKQTMVAKIDSKTDQVVALAYKMNDKGSATFIKEMNVKDSVMVELADVKEWVEIVGINKSKDSDGTISVSYKFDEKPVIKNFFFSLNVRCNNKRTYSDGSISKFANNFGLYLSSLPCTQKGDTITASWNEIINWAPHKGNVTFVIEKNKSLTFDIADEWSYGGIVTSSTAKGSGMPQVSSSTSSIQYIVPESSVVLQSAWFKTVYSNMTDETTGFINDPQYPQSFQIFLYY